MVNSFLCPLSQEKCQSAMCHFKIMLSAILGRRACYTSRVVRPVRIPPQAENTTNNNAYNNASPCADGVVVIAISLFPRGSERGKKRRFLI